MDKDVWLHERDLARQDISRNLRRKMREGRLTNKSLAARMKIAHSTVSEMVAGHRLPSALRLKQLADALGCTTDELLEGVGE